MGRYGAILVSWTLCAALLAGCGGDGGRAGASGSGTASGADSAAPEETSPPAAAVSCRIVDGAEDGTLLLAEQGEGLYGGTGVYSLPAEGLTVTLDGAAAEAGDLKDGMTVTVGYSGIVEETYPARLVDPVSLAAETPGGGSFYDLCGLYLQVLEDLWDTDAGLNDAIRYAGVDLSEAPGDLTAAEKSAIAWQFAQNHGLTPLEGTFDELVQQGYITGEPLGGDAPEDAKIWDWKEGVLFSIKPGEWEQWEAYSLPTLKFDAEKWRSMLGAYFFVGCAATWPEFGTWTGYTVESQVIS